MNRILLVVIALSLTIGILNAEDWLTIYNDDLSLVRTQFELDLVKGWQSYNFDRITSRIQPASVIITPLREIVTVAEQNYEFDLAGTDSILRKYVDREVTVTTKDQSTIVGIMKYFDGSGYGIIEKNTNKLILVMRSETQSIRLAELPSNFYTKPTLHWNLIAPSKGKFPLQLTYLTGGFNWDVVYNAVWDEKILTMNSWVTIDNRSGLEFNDVNLKLIAGDINRIRDAYPMGRTGGRGMEMAAMSKMDAAPSFEEKAFHDFHMYTLDQKVSFANNQKKQIQLFPTKSIQADGVYEYTVFNDFVSSIIKFDNKTEKGLGIPLPKGVVKVYKQDTDKNQEFIGEDSINHTSRNETIRINTGKAFDLIGRSQVLDSKSVTNKISDRTIQLTLKNNSKDKKKIEVFHQLSPYSRITNSEREYTVDRDKKVKFEVEIQPDKEVVFKFFERTEY